SRPTFGMGRASACTHATAHGRRSTRRSWRGYDALAYALVAPSSKDPIEGILEGVRIEMLGFAEVLGDPRVADFAGLLARRLEVPMLRLAWSDNRVKMPVEPAPDPAPDEPNAPAGASSDG